MLTRGLLPKLYMLYATLVNAYSIPGAHAHFDGRHRHPPPVARCSIGRVDLGLAAKVGGVIVWLRQREGYRPL